jgi:hypothetical protein
MVVFIFRFLASGNSQISMNFSYRISPSTVHFTIVSTCEAIWNTLSPTELPQPTEEEWKKKGNNLIHCGSSLTALELLIANILRYKHRITVVPFTLTTKTFSVVLLALVDANYKFTIIDIGGYGKSSDGGLFARSILGKSL